MSLPSGKNLPFVSCSTSSFLSIGFFLHVVLEQFRFGQGNQDLERPHVSRAASWVAKSVALFAWAPGESPSAMDNGHLFGQPYGP